jgi:hypothetical protein
MSSRIYVSLKVLYEYVFFSDLINITHLILCFGNDGTIYTLFCFVFVLEINTFKFKQIIKKCSNEIETTKRLLNYAC